MEDLQNTSNNEQMAINKEYLQVPRSASRQSSQLISSGLKYRNLGKSGLRASNLGLGTWTTFGAQLTEEQMEDILTFAYEGGINLFDTSEIYSGGKAETMLGNILKKKGWSRSSYIVTTKIYWGKGETDARGLSRKYIVESLKKSLERLQLDYVDIVFLHRVDSMCPMEEIVRAMTHCINNGWAMYWGTSRWSSVEIMESYTNCRQFNCITPICEQSEYHMFCRDKVELYVPELYNKIGVGCMAWSPLAMGLITSKTDDEVPIFTRPSFRKKYSNLTWSEEDRDTFSKDSKENKEGYTLLGDRLPTDESHRQRIKLREISMIAERMGCTPTQLSIAWGVKNDHVQCQLIGAPSIEQLCENLQSLQVVPKLNSHVMNELERLLDNKPVRPPIISTLQQR